MCPLLLFSSYFFFSPTLITIGVSCSVTRDAAHDPISEPVISDGPRCAVFLHTSTNVAIPSWTACKDLEQRIGFICFQNRQCRQPFGHLRSRLIQIFLAVLGIPSIPIILVLLCTRNLSLICRCPYKKLKKRLYYPYYYY